MLSKSISEEITGTQKRIDKIKDKTLFLAGKMDDITWGWIWHAVRLETADTHKDVKVDSDEFMQLVTDRFDEIIDRTQVVDSPFNTSQLMKDKKSPMGLLSAFMSEPTRNVNVLMSQFIRETKKE